MLMINHGVHLKETSSREREYRINDFSITWKSEIDMIKELVISSLFFFVNLSFLFFSAIQIKDVFLFIDWMYCI